MESALGKMKTDQSADFELPTADIAGAAIFAPIIYQVTYGLAPQVQIIWIAELEY